MKTTEGTTKLLVDSRAGIYAWKSLAESTPLFREDGTPLKAEELAGLKGENWCEELDFIGFDSIYVKSDDGKLWNVYQDGDIWAVHPEAEWDDEEDWFVFAPKGYTPCPCCSIDSMDGELCAHCEEGGCEPDPHAGCLLEA
jgi:hypothetical protein